METLTRRVLIIATILTALAAACQLGVMLWARHEMTQAETLVALHSLMFSRTGQLYYDLNHYPFVVSPYPPLFYIASAGLHRLGIPPLTSGRLLSASAAIGIIALAWNLLGICTSNRYAKWTGTLLVAVTGNLWVWGTVGQVDVPGVMFSLAGLYQYARYCKDRRTRNLIWSGVWVLIGFFCKQVMIASAAAIVLTFAWADFRRAFRFAIAVGAVALGGLLALNSLTDGHFFDNALRANINPLSLSKIRAQLGYLALVGGSLIVIAAAGAGRGVRNLELLYVYLAAVFGVFCLTAEKIGADLNYQVELLLALALCAGYTLDRLDFFPRLFRGDRGAVTLLQMPLFLYIVVNLALAAKTTASRIAIQPVRRQELAELQPFLEEARGPVISMQIDALLHVLGRIDVEGELYAAPRYKAAWSDKRLPTGSVIVGQNGLSDPEPIRRDLQEGKIPLVVLYEDIFQPQWLTASIEDLPTLPKTHLDAIRKRYRVVRWIPGSMLNGYFLYQPIEVPTKQMSGASSGASPNTCTSTLRSFRTAC